MMKVVSVTVGLPKQVSYGKRQVVTSIFKEPVEGRVKVTTLNLAGDAQADLSVHGGADKAVYAYPSEHLAGWAVELGEPLGDAAFGENLSTRGGIESDVRIGDVWKWDGALLQVSQPRWPCFKLALHRKRRDVQTRMRTTGRTGWYPACS